MKASKDKLSRIFCLSRDTTSQFQNTFPLRFRAIHIINESYIFNLVFSLIKPFLSETIRSRVRV